MKKQSNGFIRFLKYLSLVALVLMFAAATLFSLYKNGVCDLAGLVSNVDALERTYYLTQIISAFIVMISVFVAAWQYTTTVRVNATERAIRLSEYYKDNILSRKRLITYVLKESGILDVVDDIKQEDIKEFDKKEYENLLSKKKREKIEAIKKSKHFCEVILDADLIFDLGLGDIDREKKLTDEEMNKITRKFMGNIVSKTLNNLEYFAMHFTNGLADPDVVYQSLHQTYTDLVFDLYSTIAPTNPAGSRKYFTNVIELYKLWYNEDKKANEEITGFIRKKHSK